MRRLVRSAGFLAVGTLRGAPGAFTHIRIASLGLALASRRRLARTDAAALIFTPMDSVRYFELPFAWRCARRFKGRPVRYLDVGSPRALPVILLRRHRTWAADLLNPDTRDLETTRRLVDAGHLGTRTRLLAQRVEDSGLEAESYELVTCVSVLEHIPQPAAAIDYLWRALAPGGTLVITLPCASEAFDEYLDYDAYGLLPSDDAGWFFGQRFYDRRLLEDQIFDRLGRPRQIEIFGEREPGRFFRDRAAKIADTRDPSREPLAVAVGYRRFGSVDELPGIGVVALEFRKPPTD